MTRTPVEVADALFAKLREKFTDAQLVELTATLAWENYRARFDHALGVESEGLRGAATVHCPCIREVTPKCRLVREWTSGAQQERGQLVHVSLRISASSGAQRIPDSCLFPKRYTPPPLYVMLFNRIE